jgi:outer membrane protein TolC
MITYVTEKYQTVFEIFYFIAILPFLLAGCAVDQQQEIATYRDVLGGGSGSAATSQAPEPNQPLSLNDALQLANQHNEQLAIKGEEYLQALINKDRAAANFLPKVAFVPTYTREEKVTFPPVVSNIAGQFVLPETTDTPLAAQIDLNVPQDIANVNRARAAALEQKSLLLDLKSTILLDVARVYYRILLSESQVRVLVNSVAVQGNRVTDVRNKYKAGTARQLDVVQVEAQLAQTKVSLLKARNDVATGRATLAFLINTPPVAGSLSDTLQLPAQLPPSNQLLSTAWRCREDLKAAAHQVEASVHLLQEAWSQYFPSITLNFTYFLSRQSFPSEVDWIGTLGLNLPVFSAGLIHDDVRTAWSMLRQAKLYESYLQRQVDKELTVALEDYNDVAAEADELEVLVKAAEEQLQRSIYAYNAGLATNLDTLIARDQLLNARLSLTEAQFSEKIYFLNLMRILGRFDAESLESGFQEQLKYDAAGGTSNHGNIESDAGSKNNG